MQSSNNPKGAGTLYLTNVTVIHEVHKEVHQEMTEFSVFSGIYSQHNMEYSLS